MNKLQYVTSIFTAFLILLLTLNGCKDHSTSSDQPTKSKQIESPTVVNNSLSFNSREDFKGLINNLQQKSSGEIDKFVQKELSGFTSLPIAQKKLRKNKTHTTQESNTLNLNVEDLAFANILNKDGVFQIGEQVFKITNKYTYIFKNRGAYNSFKLSKNISFNSNISNAQQPCHAVEQEPVKLQEETYRVENCGTIGGGGGGGSTDDDKEYPNQDVIDLDPRKNLDKNYPSKIMQEYRSGGTKGRLKGKTWHRDFLGL